MGVRTRGHNITVALRSSAADNAARDEAARVIERTGMIATGTVLLCVDEMIGAS
jgi:hypothetical protein